MGLRRITWVILYLVLLAGASFVLRNGIPAGLDMPSWLSRVPQELGSLIAPWREEAVTVSTTLELGRPLHGEPLQGYGWQNHPLTGLPYYHRALDIAAEEGTLVTAVAPGRVNKTYYGVTLGDTVTIQHDAGWSSGYAHLSETLVSEGDFVTTGSVIGKSGKTGLLSLGSEPHLHFMLFYYGSAVDPAQYITEEQTRGSL